MSMNVQLILELVDRLSGPMKNASSAMKGLGAGAKAGGAAATATFGTMTTRAAAFTATATKAATATTKLASTLSTVGSASASFGQVSARAAAFTATAGKASAATTKLASTLSSAGAASASFGRVATAGYQVTASLKQAAASGQALANATRQEAAAADAAAAAMRRQGAAAQALAAAQRLASRAGRVGAAVANAAAAAGGAGFNGGRRIGGAVNRAEEGLNNRATIIPGLSAGKMIGIGGVLSYGAVMKKSADLAIAFEDQMANVAKVVDFEEPGGLKKMSADILQLTRTLPMTAVQIGQMVEAGGQAGIKPEELLDFARDTAKVSTAFNMSADEAGETMAKLRNIFRLNQQGIVHLSDAINVLGNDTNAKEKDIIEVLSRAGAAGKDLGLSAQQTSAFAAALLSAGTQSHVVATGLSAMMTKLSVIRKGGDMEATLGDIGLNPDKFRKTMEFSPIIGLLEVLEKIDKLEGPKKKESLLDMFGLEYQDDVGRLANALPDVIGNLKRVADRTAMIRDAYQALGGKGAVAGEELFKGLAKAGKDKATDAMLKSLGINSKTFAEAWEKDPGEGMLYFLDKLGKAKDQEAMLRRIPAQYRDGVREMLKNREQMRDFYAKEREAADSKVSGSMSREFKKRLETTKSEMQLLQNRLSEVGIGIGNDLLPHLNAAAQGIKAMMDAAGSGDGKSGAAGAIDHLREALQGLSQGVGFKDFQDMMVQASAAYKEMLNGGEGGKENALSATFLAWKKEAQELLDLFNSLKTGWQSLTGQKVTEDPEAEAKRRRREIARAEEDLKETDKSWLGQEGAGSTRNRNVIEGNKERLKQLEKEIILKKAGKIEAGTDGVRRVPTIKVDGGSRQPLSSDSFRPDLNGSFQRQDKALGGPFGSSFNGSKPSLGAGSASGGALGGIDESAEGAKARLSAVFADIKQQAETTAAGVKSAMNIDLSSQGAQAAASFASGLRSGVGQVQSAAAALKAAAAGAGGGGGGGGGGGRQAGNLRRGALLFDTA